MHSYLSTVESMETPWIGYGTKDTMRNLPPRAHSSASKFATDIGSGALPQLKGVPAGETEACKVKGKACQLKIGDGGFPVTK